MKKIGFSIGTLLSVVLSSPVAAATQWEEGRCVVGGVATLQGLECAFGNIVSIVLALSGIVLFIMLLTGGFKYLTSGGDPKAVDAARNTLTYAIGGLVVLVLAYVVLLLIKTITGVNVTEFKVKN